MCSSDLVNKLANLFESKNLDNKKNNAQNESDSNINADLWREEGHWLLLPLLLFAALWARRGWIAVVTFFILGIAQPLSQPLYAATDHLWSSPDQKAMKAFNAGNNKQAAENFTQAEWKASALYRDGDYEAAVEALKQTSNSDGFYNKGNALAQQGKYEEAIKAYDKALELNENNTDATYNREQVKLAIKKQKQQQKDQKQENQDQNQDKQEQDGKEQSQQEDSEQSEQQGEKKPGSEQPSSDNKQAPSDEEKNAEENDLKQRDAEKEEKKQAQEKQDYEQNNKQRDSDDQQKQDNQNEKQESDEQNAEDNTVENTDSEEKPAEIEINPVEASITEEQKATEQWLKRIPDDPGGLLRRKFLYQYKRIPNQNDDNEPW